MKKPKPARKQKAPKKKKSKATGVRRVNDESRAKSIHIDFTRIDEIFARIDFEAFPFAPDSEEMKAYLEAEYMNHIISSHIRSKDQIRDIAFMALESSPACAGAYVTLGQLSQSVEDKIGLFKRGELVAEHLLGKDFFEKNSGSFDQFHEARSYLKALLELAKVYSFLGDFENAILYLKKLFEVEEEAVFTLHQVLLALLTESGRYEEAEEVLERFSSETTVAVLYTRALLQFRKWGDSEDANNSVIMAIDRYRNVARALTSNPSPTKEDIRDLVQHETNLDVLSENWYVLICCNAWQQTEGAISWLAERLEKV